MATSEHYVRARIDPSTKKRASLVLKQMGLSVSDAIRVLLLRVAEEQRLPFEIRVPNATTQAAYRELESRKGKRFKNVKDLMDDLHAED